MNQTNRSVRAAFTLVEVIAATAIMAVLTTSSFAIVRTAHSAWLRHRSDSEQRREAVAALQHIVRRVRQATAVAAVSTPSDVSGSLTVLMPDGTSAIWDHDAPTNRVNFGTVTANSLLAQGITEMNCIALSANGTSQATTPDLAHSVRCTLKYALSRPTGSVTETVTGLAWLRAW